jgi:hypothetical protein
MRTTFYHINSPFPPNSPLIIINYHNLSRLHLSSVLFTGFDIFQCSKNLLKNNAPDVDITSKVIIV